jgi:ABC-type amino acid transport substrate-binding protein
MWLTLALLCWALAVRWAGRTWFPPQTDPTWEQIQRDQVVRVGMDATYMPFGCVSETGHFNGFDVELANELANRMGVRAEFVNISFDGLYDALLAGKCDVLISALPYDETLTQDVLFSPSYFNAGLLLVIREEQTDVRSARSLAGKRVGVAEWTSGHLEARRLQEQARIALENVTFESGDEALEALRSVAVDAAIVDSLCTYRFVRQRGGIRYLKQFLADEQYVIAMRPDAGYLWKRIAGDLGRMQTDGFLRRLQDDWL